MEKINYYFLDKKRDGERNFEKPIVTNPNYRLVTVREDVYEYYYKVANDTTTEEFGEWLLSWRDECEDVDVDGDYIMTIWAPGDG